MPSLLPEPFGLVAVEALQSGIPLVAFEHSPIAQEAEGLKCGFTASALNAKSLADALRNLDDDVVVKSASKRAFDLAHSLTCTEIEWRDQLLTLYRALLTGAKNASLDSATKPLSAFGAPAKKPEILPTPQNLTEDRVS